MGWPGAGRREQGEFVVNGVMGRIGSPPNSYMETPSTTEIGDEAFREVTKVKRGHKGGALITQDWYPFKKRRRRKACPPSTCEHRKGHTRIQREGSRLLSQERVLTRHRP